MVNNSEPLSRDLLDLSEDTSAERIGSRIREIRVSEGISQVDLGKSVGLDGARMHKYENGLRKPKDELLKSIAKALGVETLALTDPVVSSYLGAMYAFFEMEKHYDLKLNHEDGRLSLSFGDGISGTMNDYLREWARERKVIDLKLQDAESEEERKKVLHEYDMWEWTFPRGISDRSEQDYKDMKRAKLEEKKREIEKQIAALEG